MIDFNINRGPSTVLFLEPGVINPRLIIEEGCWYLCTDTAELFLGIRTEDGLTLKRINEFDNDNSEVIELLNAEISALKESLSTYAKKSDIPNVSKFITEEEVDAKGYLTEHQDLSNYALKTDIPTDYLKEIPAEYITESELAEELAKLEHPSVDLSGYATEQFVTAALNELEIPDVSNFVTMGDIEAKGYITEIPSEYITESELAAKGFITDVSGKADIDHNHDDLYDAKGTASAIRDELLNGAGEAYDTLKELGNLIDDNKEALEALEIIATGKADKDHHHLEYLTEQSLDDYAKKTDIPDVTGFISEIPAEYITETELEAKGFLTAHQDLSEYAKKSDIPTDYLTAVPEEYITESELAEELAKIEHPTVDLNGYATEAWVNAQKFLTEHQDLSSYAKLTDIPTDYLKEIPAEYVTETELDAKGYLTEHQNLDAYAKKNELFSKSYNDLTDRPEIPSIEGLATEEFVRTEIEKIDVPTIDTTNLVTTEILNSTLATKANEVPFTSAKFITKPLGNFEYGENIKNFSVAEILAKLLGLEDNDPTVQEPTEPDGIVNNIIENKTPMYTVTMAGTVEEVPFKLFTLTEDSATVIATEPGFYQIINATGDAIESGYQELQINNDDVYYVIALPKEIDYDSMISVKAWNELEGRWTETGIDKPALTSDVDEVAALCEEAGIDISHIDTTVYTVWAMEGTPDGSKYRFVINE